MKRSKAIGVLIIAATFLCGCYDSREVDETAYIIALGIDDNEENGYTYTIQFSAPLESVSGEGGASGSATEGEENENSTVRNVVIKAKDFYTAKNMTNNFMGKNVDMSHLKLIVFSNKIDKDGILKHSQFLLREREIRPHTAVAVSEGSAEKYIKSVKPELEANTAKYYELMSKKSNNVYSPTKRLSHFVDELLSETGVSFLPIARISSQKQLTQQSDKESMLVDTQSAMIESKRAELRGMAIFRNGKIVAEDEGDFAMIYNILSRSIKECTVSLKNPYEPDEIVSFKIVVPGKAFYSVDKEASPCRINVSQTLDVELLGGTLPDGFSTPEELFEYTDNVITQRFTEYFYDLSRGKRADIMKIGDCVKAQMVTDAEWNASKWEKQFESASFRIDVNLRNQST